MEGISAHDNLLHENASLRLTVARYELMLKNGAGTLVMWSSIGRDGQITSLNGSAEKYMFLAPCIGQLAAGVNISGHNCSTWVSEGFHEALAGKEIRKEQCINTSGESRKWFKSYFQPVRSQQGNIENVLWCIFDTTIDRETKAKEKQDIANLQALFDSSPQIYILINPHYNIISFNKIAAIYYKEIYNIDIKIGDRYLDYVNEKRKQSFEDNFTRTLKGEIIKFEREFLYPDGKSLWFETFYLPVYDNKGRIFAVAYNRLNITERKKNENASRETARQMTAIIETVGEGITLSSLDGHFEIFNSRMEQITGYTHTEANSYKNFLEKIYPDPEARKRESETIGQLAQTGGINELETNIVTKSGEIRTLLVSSTVMTVNGQQRFLSAYRDISLRKKAETALRNSEKELRELNATKDKLFSIIAHDLKNPFHLIKGFADLLVKYYGKLDESKIRSYHDLIYNSARQGFNLLQNLLDWSRAQTGRLKFIPRKIDISELITNNISLHQAQAQKKGITLVYPDNEPHFALADENMLNTVLRNLIANAIKFTGQEGRITLNCKPDNDMLCISVADTGVGIAPADLTRLFKIDEQVSSPGTDQEKGTGLGLILCKEFVEKNGGQIWAESQIGHGSTFKFTLPANK